MGNGELVHNYCHNGTWTRLEQFSQDGKVYPKNTNLNTLKQPAIYAVWTDSQVTTALNFPINNVAGMIIVESMRASNEDDYHYVRQLYITRSNSNMYQRMYDINTHSWSVWKTIW